MIPQPTPVARPRYWILAIWAFTGILTVTATVMAVLPVFQIPVGEDPDHHRELVAQFIRWFIRACCTSVVGFSVMLATGRLFLGHSQQDSSQWRQVRWILLTLHLAPWILAVLRTTKLI
jgi:hypothetical protein